MRRFPPVQDIVNIRKQSIDINRIDLEMRGLLRNVSFAAKKDTTLSKNVQELRSFIDDMLRQFMFTHVTLRIMVRHAYKKNDYPIIADTASLIREQIEKIYVLVTIFQDPKHWMRQYIRNGWQKDYERYLLMQDEHGESERYDEYLQAQYPYFLETQRRPPVFGIVKGKRKTLVSEFAKRCVWFNWYHPDAPKPTWFKRPGSVKRFV